MAPLPARWLASQGEHAWLEEVEGDAALGWAKERNKKTLEVLGEPSEAPLYTRLLNILEDKRKIPQVGKYGDWYYNFWQDKENPRGLWRRTTLESYKQEKLKA